MPKQKILFLITKSNFGGAQRYVFDLATSLSKSFDVKVALGGEGRLVELLGQHDIPTVPIPNLARDISLADELRAFMKMVRMLRTERPDILHLNSAKAGGLGALAGRLAGIPHIIFTAHAWAWNEERPLSARALIALLHWLTVILAHRTICVSHAVYDEMARFPFTKRRMRVIHLGIMPPPRLTREQARAAFIERLPSLAGREHAPWIATVGELHPIKGHRFALAAMAKLQKDIGNFVYLVIGEGEERLRIEKIIHDENLVGTVHLLGHIDGVSSLFPAFDVFVLPSLSEAFGYVLLEAGAAEVPIIASSVGGIPEVIAEDSGTLVPPHDAQALYESIKRVLASPRENVARALTLKQRIEHYFSKDRMVEETVALYE